MDKKEAAEILYNQGWTQKAISDLGLGSTKTICGWVEKGQWDKKRIQHSLNRETAEEGVWALINFQLEVLKRIADQQKEKLKEPELSVKELQELLTSKGDIDALQKLFTTIKGKELEWTTLVKVIRELMEYIEQHDLNLAKSMVEITNMFINEKRKEM